MERPVRCELSVYSLALQSADALYAQTPLSLNQVSALASRFIASCPPTNPPLPAGFAALTLPDPASARPGSTTPIAFTPPSTLDRSAKLYGAFLSGQDALILPLSDDWKSVSIPDSLRGTVFLLVTTDENGVDDSKTVAGPALLEFPFYADSALQRLPVY